MILNLKNLNLHVEYNKFKMDTLQSILKLVTPGCYVATIEIKDAYYSVPVAQEHCIYLRFIWRSKLYQYTCFPNGLSSAPGLFTKLMKPCYVHLRCQGHIVSVILMTLIFSNSYSMMPLTLLMLARVFF